MEKRVQLKIDCYLNNFKEHLIEIIHDSDSIPAPSKKNLIHEIKTHPSLILTNEDFIKRKRVKNSVPYFERCIAKRADGEQCTRRRKDLEQFCGTHLKGAPHGTIENTSKESNITKITVWQQEIKGIIYYIDNNNNVYCTEDIYNNAENTKIIAKYEKNGEKYRILN